VLGPVQFLGVIEVRFSFLIAVAVLLFAPPSFAQNDGTVRAKVQRVLNAYSIKSVHAAVQGTTVTLTGTVDLCSTRVLADQLASRIDGIQSVRDGIQVLGPVVPDEELSRQVKKLIADRIRKLGGFGFGSISSEVKQGVVALNGRAAPQLTIPTLTAIGKIPGVKNVLVNVEIISPANPGWKDSGLSTRAGVSTN